MDGIVEKIWKRFCTFMMDRETPAEMEMTKEAAIQHYQSNDENSNNTDFPSSTQQQHSRLGYLDHWNDVYEMELENFQSFGDQGEIW